MDKLIGGLIGLVIGLFAGILLGALLKDSIAIRAQDAAMQGAAKEIAKLEVKHTIINQKMQTKIITEKVYQECKHSDDAYKLILEAYRD